MKKMKDKQIEEFKRYLQDEERAAATIEKYIRDVVAFCIWSAGQDGGRFFQ